MPESEDKRGPAEGERPVESGQHDGRLCIGATVISVLGLSFGASLATCGSVLRWRSDSTLGLFNQSGWRFDNLVAGDGKITVVIAAVMAVAFVAGAVFLNRWAYGLAVACSSMLLALTVYEIVLLLSRSGITGPGNGLYMVLGGGVAALLCGLGGYLMTAEGSTRPEATASGQI